MIPVNEKVFANNLYGLTDRIGPTDPVIAKVSSLRTCKTPNIRTVSVAGKRFDFGNAFRRKQLVGCAEVWETADTPYFAVMKRLRKPQRGEFKMQRPFRSLLVLVTTIATLGVTQLVQAQGLLWSLPEDQTWVKYTGKYKNKEEQPGNNAGPLQLEWLSELTIQSVGTEMAQFQGAEVPCRWIEFKVVTGLPSTGGVETGAAIDPGPFGVRIYKVLVPESRITGKLRDEQDLPVMFIPIVKGIRKIGRDAPPEAIKEKILAFYPVLGMFGNYLDLAPEGAAENLDLPGYGPVMATSYKGTLRQKNAEISTENVGQIWLSPDVPFGWAKYQVKITRQRKSKFAPESDFAPSAEIEVEMAAVEKGTGAKSEIGDVDPATLTPTATEEKAADAKPATEQQPAAEATPEN